MDQMLLIDCCASSGFELQLSESTMKGGLTKFRGKFQEAEAVNKNKRMYPFDVLSENIGRLQEAIDDRRLVGELDHPTDSIIHFANTSHVVTKLWWEGNVLMGEGEILNTPSGMILKSLIDGGVKVGISSRGVGNGKVNEDGILVIGESYKLITFDAVADPSTFAAFQEKVVAKGESFNPQVKEQIRSTQQKSKIAVKNESSSIHNVNKEVLIAYLSGFVKSQTQEIKSRLG
ncbi:hypothetical protein EBZ39_08040 [bacterium]|nr:hypothetical protein [bacterium]